MKLRSLATRSTLELTSWIVAIVCTPIGLYLAFRALPEPPAKPLEIGKATPTVEAKPEALQTLPPASASAAAAASTGSAGPYSFSSVAKAIEVTRLISDSSQRNQELIRLSRVALKRSDWPTALQAATLINDHGLRDQTLDLVSCYAVWFDDLSTATQALTGVYDTSVKNRMLARISEAASTGRGEGSNEVQCARP